MNGSTRAPRLVGFGGKLASGKDAAAEALIEELGYIRLGFSDVLRDFALALDVAIEVDGEHRSFSALDAELGFTEAKSLPAFREHLVDIGGALRTLISSTAIIDAAESRISAALAAGESVVITGVRFPGEVALIERLGGLTVYVERPGFGGNGDATETSVSASDFAQVLVNDGTLDDLHSRALALVEGGTN